MKTTLFLLLVIFASCNEGANTNVAETPKDTLKKDDYRESKIEQSRTGETTEPVIVKDTSVSVVPNTKVYGNKRFKDVRVEKGSGNSFRITGRAQVFEASLSWIVEDGHDELLKGHQTTDAGAPEWGKFDFTIKPEKKRANSSLTLVIFEASAMDGSRQHELAIPLK